MHKDIESQLAKLLGDKITGVRPISGGDISKAYVLQLNKGKVFCKLNYSEIAYSLFKQELKGLNLIANSGAIKTPEVLGCSSLENGACLLLEYIEQGHTTTVAMRKFGHQLAKLHLCDTGYFGLDEDNYIGSLPQSNRKHAQWAGFYAQERLLPQLQLAIENNLLSRDEVPQIGTIEKTVEKYAADINPSLLHGDLWGGNYLINPNGDPCLIDPAVYYGDAEVDLAMSKLFGGFQTDFYTAYHEMIPRTTGYAQRQDLYQLYYLLVHLNLFGKSYYPQVAKILRHYF